LDDAIAALDSHSPIVRSPSFEERYTPLDNYW
jgi:hypothetical protein